MSHEQGTYLGGIRDVESMRLRCVCDSHTGCWHIRSARGRKLTGKRQIVWVHGIGTMTVTRAMWMFSRGKPPPENRVVARKCDSLDCVNPEHLALLDRQAFVRSQVRRGSFDTDRARENARKAAAGRRVLSDELRVWLIESTQSGVEVAAALGVKQSRVNAIRQQARARLPKAAASIFSLGAGMAANDGRTVARREARAA